MSYSVVGPASSPQLIFHIHARQVQKATQSFPGLPVQFAMEQITFHWETAFHWDWLLGVTGGLLFGNSDLALKQ